MNTLVKEKVKERVDSLKNGASFKLYHLPETNRDAWGAVCSYLSGTAEYERAKAEASIKNERGFKALDVGDFRKKVAREFRDSRLGQRQVNFLVQAFRFRGKANYRDSIYLSYGENHEDKITQFLDDLAGVGCAFLKMAVYFVSRRVVEDSWNCFVADLKENCLIDLPVDLSEDYG